MVGEFKKNFSKVIESIKEGEEVTIRSGRRKENIAVLIPYAKYSGRRKKKLGILESRASFSLKENFNMTDEEFLSI